MSPTITMFCKDCGEPVTGQFAATCMKCVSKKGVENCHSLQRLKAEIAAICVQLGDLYLPADDDEKTVKSIIERLRQLSAMQKIE